MPRDLCTTKADTCESRREATAAVAVTLTLAASRCEWAWMWESDRFKACVVGGSVGVSGEKKETKHNIYN